MDISQIKAGQYFKVTTVSDGGNWTPPVGTVITALLDGNVLFAHKKLTKAELAAHDKEWSTKGFGQIDENSATWFNINEIEPLTPVAKEPNAGTQAATVLDHLRRADYITDSQATSLYGIGQCAGVVFKLRKAGFQINSIMRDCIKPNATRYAEYRLA